MRGSSKLAGAALLWLGFGPLAEAVPLPAISISNVTGATLGNPPFTLGWSFETDTLIVVTDLGLFDSDQDGLAQSHELGLWDSTGTLLASATVGSGLSGALEEQFRYVDIAPVGLSPGSYIVGALFTQPSLDPLVFTGDATGFAAAPGITFFSPLYTAGSVLSVPGSALGIGMEPGYFGPNFRYEVVPEPGSLILIGAGFLGMALKRRTGLVGTSSGVGDPYGPGSGARESGFHGSRSKTRV